MKAGDIILTRDDSFISKAIRRFGREKNEPALVSHAGVFICERHVIEALFSGVKTTLFPRGFWGSEFLVASPLNVNDFQREMIASKALNFSARTYGFTKIFGQALDYLSGSDFFTSKIFVMDRFPICSYVVAEAYAALGKTFGVPTKSTTPDDILDFILDHPDKYHLVEATPQLLHDAAKQRPKNAARLPHSACG